MAIGARDEVAVRFTGDIRDLQADIRRLEGQVDRMTDEMGRDFERAGRRSRAAIAGIGRGFAALGTAAAVGIGLAVREASSAEEIQAKFETVFGESAAAADAWAESTGAALNRSSTDIRSYLSTFQDTFVPLGASREEAAGLSQDLTQLAVDLASFNNANEPETVQLLTSALVGNHEAVRRYGIVLTQATLEQELLNMGITGGAINASNMERAMARLNIIMRSTSDAQGDAARTADSFANRSRGLMGEIRETGEVIGTAFIPGLLEIYDGIEALLPLIAQMGASLGTVFSDLTEDVGDVVEALAGVPRELGGTTEEIASHISDVEEMMRALQIAAPRLADGIPNEFRELREALGDELGAERFREIFATARANGEHVGEAFLEALQTVWEELDEARVEQAGVDAGELFMSGFYRAMDDDDEGPEKDIEALRDAFVEASVAAAGVTSEMAEIEAKGEDVRRKTSDIVEEIQEVEESTERLAKSFEREFVDAMATGRLEVSNLADAIRYEIAQAIYDAFIGDSIRSGIRFVTNLITGGGNGIPSGAKATPRKSGGQTSGLTLVGEDGPELINVGPNASVITANMTSAVMRGQTSGPSNTSTNLTVAPVFNVDATGADESAVARLDEVLQARTAQAVAMSRQAAMMQLTKSTRNRNPS